MLRNLLDNAIKYCPQGTQVRVILQPRKILIEDNGDGVLPEEISKLGQRFYRPAGKMKREVGSDCLLWQESQNCITIVSD